VFSEYVTAMNEVVTLNRKEQLTLQILGRVDRGEIPAGRAAEMLSLSVRQIRRKLAAYRGQGAAGLVHGNRGRVPANATPAPERERMVELASSTYIGCNHTQLTEFLDEREEIHRSRSTVRRVLLVAGQRSPRKHKGAKRRSRRERYPQEGMLLQTDGSRHDWLEGRGPYLTLIGAIDDATGKVPSALFRGREDSQGYFLMLERIIRDFGRPLALYHDRHGVFEHTPRDRLTIAEELTGKPAPTQFGRLLSELEIASISALSPQAKGRVERLWGTFQDRLVTELRLAETATIEDANQVLQAYLPKFNERFAVPPAQEGSAYRPLPANSRLEDLFCFKYERTVRADNTVKLGELCLQLQASPERASYARCVVELHERMDGSVAVWYQGKEIATTEAPPEAPVLRVRGNRRTRQLPPPERPVLPLSLAETHRRMNPDPVTTGVLASTGHGRPTPPRPGPNHPWKKELLQSHTQNQGGQNR